MSAASDKQRHTVWWSAGAAYPVEGMLYLREKPGAEVTFIYNDAH